MDTGALSELDFDALKTVPPEIKPLPPQTPQNTDAIDNNKQKDVPLTKRVTRNIKSESEVGDVPNYTCELCSKIFDKKASFDYHMQFHTGSRRVCPHISCTKTFTSEIGFKKHLNVHNNDTPIKSEPKKEKETKQNEAPKKGQGQSSAPVKSEKPPLKKDKVTNPTSVIEPTESDEEFNSRSLPEPGTETEDFYSDLMREMTVEGGKTRFVCRKCQSTCTRRADVRRHWRSTCPGNPYPEIVCRHCLPAKKICRGTSNLIAHVMTHGLKGEFICLRCHTLVTTQNHLDKHLEICQVKPPK